MEELARVVAVDKGVAWVEKERQSQCGGCRLRHGCGSAVLGKILGVRRNRIRVISSSAVQVGDKVAIHLDPAALLKVSFYLYMVPLFGVFLGAMIGKFAFAPIVSTEGITILFAMLGLMAAAWWLRGFSRRIAGDEKYQPIISRVITAEEPITGLSCPS